MVKMNWKPACTLLAIFSMLALGAACIGDGSSGNGQVKGDTTGGPDDLTAGAFADVHVETLADGTLYAFAINLDGKDGEDDDDDDDNDDNDDGEDDDDDDNDDGENEDDDDDDNDDNDDGQNVDDDDDDNDDNDDGEDDGEEGKEKFEVQVDSVMADFSSFIVFGDLVVMMEPDDGDANEQPGEGGEGDEANDLEIPDLAPGLWIEAKGVYDVAAGIFYAEEITARTDGETDASIESLIDTVGDGSFTMLGLTITYDANTEISGAEENDGVDCEQDGENEGENQNC
jgi:hypothetical protein